MEKLERLRDARHWQLVEARSRNVLSAPLHKYGNVFLRETRIPSALRDGPPGLLRVNGFISVFTKCCSKEAYRGEPGGRHEGITLQAISNFSPSLSTKKGSVR